MTTWTNEFCWGGRSGHWHISLINTKSTITLYYCPLQSMSHYVQFLSETSFRWRLTLNVCTLLGLWYCWMFLKGFSASRSPWQLVVLCWSVSKDPGRGERFLSPCWHNANKGVGCPWKLPTSKLLSFDSISTSVRHSQDLTFKTTLYESNLQSIQSTRGGRTIANEFVEFD